MHAITLFMLLLLQQMGNLPAAGNIPAYGSTSSNSTLGPYWTGIVASTRAINWTTAGVVGTIPVRTTQCSAISAYSGTAAAINSAIAACPANQYVSLGAGTFNLSSGVIFNNKSNVTLRGAGASLTNLVFSGGNTCSGQGADICIMNGDLNWVSGPTNTANWTAGYSNGATTITLDNTSNLTIGSVLILDQLNDTTDSGMIDVCETAGTCSAEGPAGAERTNRAQQQMVTVTGVSGSTVTISPGLYMPNWRTSQAPGAWWANTQVSGVGIENLTVDGTADTASISGVTLFNANNVWLTGVAVLNTKRNHVWLYQAVHTTIRNSYFYGTQGGVSQSYGIETYGSSDNLIENNIFQHIVSPTVINSSASGTVIAYNFSINDYYTASTTWFMGAHWLHSAGADNVLYEGNVGAGLTSDIIHGSHHFVTAFRNRFTGWEAGKTQQTVPVNIYAHSRYYNLVGNILGTVGYHNNYLSATPSGIDFDTSIIDLGWGDPTGSVAPADSLVQPSIMLWGNYDVVNGGPRFVSGEVPSGIGSYANAVPVSQALPPSFYLSSTPLWWGSQQWPPIGSDVSGGNIGRCSGGSYSGSLATSSAQCTGGSLVTDMAGTTSSIPAMDCFLASGGKPDGSGSAITFNASSCY